MFYNSLINTVKKHREILMYIVCGIATTIVSLLTYFLCAEFIFDVSNAVQLQITNIISWVLSVMFAFVTNKILVFKSKYSPFKELVKFYLARIGTLFIDMLLMYIFVSVCSMDDMLVKCAVQFIVIILNYLFGKLVFTKEKSYEKI